MSSATRKVTKEMPLKKERGLVDKNADEPHFYPLRHPLPLKNLPHLSALADPSARRTKEIDSLLEVRFSGQRGWFLKEGEMLKKIK